MSGKSVAGQSGKGEMPTWKTLVSAKPIICRSFEIIFLSSEDGTRIDGRNILKINDHDVLCSYFECVFVFSFRLPFGAAYVKFATCRFSTFL